MIKRTSGMIDPRFVKKALADIHYEAVLGPVEKTLLSPALSQGRYHLHQHQAVDDWAFYSGHLNFGAEMPILATAGPVQPADKSQDPLIILDIFMSEVVCKGTGPRDGVVIELPDATRTRYEMLRQPLEDGRHLWWIQRVETEQELERRKFFQYVFRHTDPSGDPPIAGLI